MSRLEKTYVRGLQDLRVARGSSRAAILKMMDKIHAVLGERRVAELQRQTRGN